MKGDEEKMSSGLEKEYCSRCGGTGHYSYCQMHGTVCFQCQGRRIVLTKRGAEANRYLIELRSKRADQLVPGDEVQYKSPVSGSGWIKVLEIVPWVPQHKTVINGVEQETRPGVEIKGTFGKTPFSLFSMPETTHRVRQTEEQSIVTLAKALEYQGKLTKGGKPREDGKWVDIYAERAEQEAKRLEKMRKEQLEREEQEKREQEERDRQEQLERDRNGGKTDAEVRAEREEQAKWDEKVKWRTENGWLIQVIERLSYQTDFTRGMVEKLERGPATKLTPRMLDILRDIYGREVGGRKGSKKFTAAVEEFDVKTGQVAGN